jgi:hypothetical protein
MADRFRISTEYATDFLRNPFKILGHLVIPKSEHSKTARFELPGPRIIVTFLRIGMLFSIEFDNQPCLDTAEIDNEFVDRNLSAKFPGIELSTLKD